MKRSLLAIVLLMGLSLTTHAQMQKGSWMADGQVGGYATDEKSEHKDPSWDDYNLSSKTTSFYLVPGVGYFIQDNLALGISGRFQVVTASAQNGENEELRGNQLSYGMGLFSRKYFPAGERLSFYGDLRAGGLWGLLAPFKKNPRIEQ